MLRLENTEAIFLLALIPALILLFIFFMNSKRGKLNKLGNKNLIKQLVPERSSFKNWLKFILMMLALVFLIMGAAGVLVGSRLEEVKREGVDIMIALDVSNSMKAEDIRPNRLERAKQFITRLISQMGNDRIGIVVFAGNAYVHLPITVDHSAARLFLTSIDTDIVPRQGTDIGTALDLAVKSFGDSITKHNAIIIITDGEDHEEHALGATKNATEKGITVHTVGMGSPEGVPIPVYSGGQRTGFLKDREGNTVLTRLNENILQQIASAGGGVYIRATNSGNELNVITNEINKMTKREFESKVFTQYENRFQYFVGAAIILLIIELLLSERRSKWWQTLNLFGENKK